jgi:hypothetical protein
MLGLIRLHLLTCAGDPSRRDVAEEDMSWTIRCDDMTTVTAFPLPGSPSSLGYMTRESDKCTPRQQALTPPAVTEDGASA